MTTLSKNNWKLSSPRSLISTIKVISFLVILCDYYIIYKQSFLFLQSKLQVNCNLDLYIIDKRILKPYFYNVEKLESWYINILVDNVNLVLWAILIMYITLSCIFIFQICSTNIFILLEGFIILAFLVNWYLLIYVKRYHLWLHNPFFLYFHNFYLCNYQFHYFYILAGNLNWIYDIYILMNKIYLGVNISILTIFAKKILVTIT